MLIFYDFEEAASYLHINQATLFDLAQNGAIRPQRIGEQSFFAKTDLDNWNRSRHASASANPYGDFNTRLLPKLDEYGRLDDAEFQFLIGDLSSLPALDSPERSKQLEVSGLLVTLSRLANEIRQSARQHRAHSDPVGRFELLWQGCRAYRALLNERSYGSFAITAAELDCADIFVEVWKSVQERGVALSEAAYGTFADAAGRLRLGKILHLIWELPSPERSIFKSRTWGALASACARTEDGDLLDSVWSAWLKSGAPLDGRGWSTFAWATGKTSRAEILLDLWGEIPARRNTAGSGRMEEFRRRGRGYRSS